MTTVHLHTPINPNVAACGDAAARAFTPWRWKATCENCKWLTAAHVLDEQTDRPILYRQDLPVRFSVLVALIRRKGLPNAEAAIADFESDRKKAARCNKHGALADPIALLDAANNRMVFVCPACAPPLGSLRLRWESGT